MTVSADLNNAVAAINKLKTHKGVLNTRVGALDKQVNDHYHVIELLDLSASELSKVTKSLKALLRERREVKEHVIAVSNFLAATADNAKPAEVSEKNAKTREQKYVTEALQSYQKIFGKAKNVSTKK